MGLACEDCGGGIAGGGEEGGCLRFVEESWLFSIERAAEALKQRRNVVEAGGAGVASETRLQQAAAGANSARDRESG